MRLRRRTSRANAREDSSVAQAASTAARPRGLGGFWLRALAACAAGAATSGAFPPIEQPWLAVLGPVLLWAAVLRTPRSREAFALGLAYGIPFYAITLDFMGRNLGALVLGSLATYQAVYAALGCAAGRAACTRAPEWAAPLLLACGWALFDWLRSSVGAMSLTLVDLGYALHAEIPLIQIADLGGVLLVTWLLALTSASGAAALQATLTRASGRHLRAMRLLAVPASLWVLAAVYGSIYATSTDSGLPANVAVVQPARTVPSFYTDRPMSSTLTLVRVYRQLLEQAGIRRAELVLLPESGVSDDIQHVEWARRAVGELAAELGAWVATGYHMRPVNGRNYNTVGLVDPTGTVRQVYIKRHLLAFGEFLPFRERLKLLYKRYPIRPYDISPGKEVVVFRLDGMSFAPIICFESIFAGEARRALRAGGEGLVVFTNDGWFDSHKELALHARASVFRAIEFRVPVVRCASTGYSGLVDSRGRWVEKLGPDESGALLVTPHLKRPASLYYVVGNAGVAAPCVLALAAPLVGSWWRGRRRSREDLGAEPETKT